MMPHSITNWLAQTRCGKQKAASPASSLASWAWPLFIYGRPEIEVIAPQCFPAVARAIFPEPAGKPDVKVSANIFNRRRNRAITISALRSDYVVPLCGDNGLGDTCHSNERHKESGCSFSVCWSHDFIPFLKIEPLHYNGASSDRCRIQSLINKMCSLWAHGCSGPQAAMRWTILG